MTQFTAGRYAMPRQGEGDLREVPRVPIVEILNIGGQPFYRYEGATTAYPITNETLQLHRFVKIDGGE